MTTPAPPLNHSQEPPRLIAWLNQRRIVRLELGVVAAFHTFVGLGILLVPRDQVITPGTSAIFGTIPPTVWAAWFLTTAAMAVASAVQVTQPRLSLTWTGVFPLGAAWIYGLTSAVAEGSGNAILAIAWPFLLIWWFLLAVRLHLGGTEARWDGS